MFVNKILLIILHLHSCADVFGSSLLAMFKCSDANIDPYVLLSSSCCPIFLFFFLSLFNTNIFPVILQTMIVYLKIWIYFISRIWNIISQDKNRNPLVTKNGFQVKNMKNQMLWKLGLKNQFVSGSCCYFFGISIKFLVKMLIKLPYWA